MVIVQESAMTSFKRSVSMATGTDASMKDWTFVQEAN